MNAYARDLLLVASAAACSRDGAGIFCAPVFVPLPVWPDLPAVNVAR